MQTIFNKNNLKVNILLFPLFSIVAKRSFSAMIPVELIKTPRVLSIQSHTTHGYVGNKAATFPLQTMGFDVDCINSVSLSNHPAYPGGCKGVSLDPKDLTSFVDGLHNNNLLDYDVLVTGYNRSPDLLSAVETSIKKIK